jgi:hypothetical protein
MADSFDPYHKWLGISPKDQPPNHYRLLAIELFESDPDVIESAADQRMSHVRTFQSGQNSAVSQRLLNELSTAKLCLLHPQKKADYDRQLRQKIEPAASPPPSVGNALRGVLNPSNFGTGINAPPPSVGNGLRAVPPADSAVVPLPLGEPAPLVIASSSTTGIHRRTQRKPPIWQQPAVLAVAAAAIVLAALGIYFLSAGGKSPVVAKASPATHPSTIATKSTVPVKADKKAAKDSATAPEAASAPDTTTSSSSSTKPDFEIIAADWLPGKTIDLLKRIDLKRDSLAGEWRMEGKELVAPGAPFGNLQAPVTAPDEYTLTLVANCGETARDVMVGLPIDGRHVLLCLDGWTGSLSGLHLIDDKDGDDNETTFHNKVLHEGPNEVVCVVRKSSIHVDCNGKSIIQWQGDASRLSTASILKIPEQAYPCLLCWATPYRVSKFELAPLVAKAPATAVAAGAGEKTTTSLLKVFEDEPTFVVALTSADHGSEAVLASNEAYSGQASVRVTPTQRFSEALPGLNVKIRKQPTAADEYRFLRFAWKKRGGEQIWLQLHYPGNWFRYRAGPNRSGGWSGVRVADELPDDFVVVTRDLAADFGEFTLTGIGLTPNDGECAWFDHIYLAKTLEDFDRIEVSPKKSPERKFADLSADNQTRLDVPDEAALKEARKHMLTKAFSAELAAAKMPDARRQLAQRIIKQAAETEDNVALAYALYRQAADLAEAAGDLDLAWQAIDELARAFAVDEVALRQQSLTEVGKGAKSPEQARERVDDACRLMAAALAASQGMMVKKVAAQAQSFAKRSKDGALIKEIAIRMRDANKLAAELDAVAAARDKLKAMPDDPDANFTVGRYEICAAGDWEQALPKLAKGSDAEWKKLAGDDLMLSSASATVEQKTAAADGWLAMAEKEVWPARHYLRMRATEWLRRAWPSLSGKNRTEAHQRLKTLLAVDDGWPDWKRFDVLGGQEIGGYMHLDKEGAIRTPVEYEGPIDVSFVARTDSTNIRLYAHDHPAVVWNWESNPSILRVRRPTGESLEIPTAPLQPNRWYRFRYAITPQSTTIWVDGAVVFTENRAYAAIGRSMVSVHGAVGSIVDVKKLVVKPMK